MDSCDLNRCVVFPLSFLSFFPQSLSRCYCRDAATWLAAMMMGLGKDQEKSVLAVLGRYVLLMPS